MLSLEKKMAWVLASEMGCRRNCIKYQPSTGWILEPESLPPNDRLPVKGKCCWNRKGNSLVSGKYLLVLTPSQGFN